MKEDSLSTKTMLLNIIAMRKVAVKFTKNGKPYNDFLSAILAEDYYYGEKQIPTVKVLADKTGLTVSKVRKHIEAIYHYLVINWEIRPVFSITKVRYEIYIKSWQNKSLIFDLDHLPVIPRVGEEVYVVKTKWTFRNYFLGLGFY